MWGPNSFTTTRPMSHGYKIRSSVVIQLRKLSTGAQKRIKRKNTLLQNSSLLFHNNLIL